MMKTRIMQNWRNLNTFGLWFSKKYSWVIDIFFFKITIILVENISSNDFLIYRILFFFAQHSITVNSMLFSIDIKFDI